MSQFNPINLSNDGVYVILEAIPQSAFSEQTYRAIGVCSSYEEAQTHAGIGRIIQGPVPFMDRKFTKPNLDIDPIYPFKPNVNPPSKPFQLEDPFGEKSGAPPIRKGVDWGQPLHSSPLDPLFDKKNYDPWNQDINDFVPNNNTLIPPNQKDEFRINIV